MKILKVREVKTPTRGTSQSAGLDFYVPTDLAIGKISIELAPGEACKIPSGIKAKVPKGMALVAFNKSGVALSKGLQVGACVVDEDYQGEIHIHLTNTSNDTCNVWLGEKIVQFLLLPVSYEGVEVCKSENDLYGGEVTERGEGGFGSTNKS